jgi:predicted ester cyclase
MAQQIRKGTNLITGCFPDAQTIIEDLIAEGDKVVVRSITRATQIGPMMGLPPTGRQVDYGGVDIFGWWKVKLWNIGGNGII